MSLPKRRHSDSSWVCSSRPEPVVRRPAVDHRLDPEVVEELHLLGRGHDADRRAAAVEHVLHRVAAEAAGRPPHEHLVALGHPRAVGRDEHAVGGGVAQRVDGRLLPAEVRRLRHELVGLHDRDVGQTAEVGLEAPDALVGGQHGVVVGRRVLVVNVVAVDRDLVAGAPVAHRPSRRAAPPPRRRSRPRGSRARGGAPHGPSLARRSRKPNVGSGSKIDVQTVLKLIDEAITAT